MPLPYRKSTYSKPVHVAPPIPTTPEELEALMEREMGPRPSPTMYAPLIAVMQRSCRFHPRVWSSAAIHRGMPGDDDGWVLLCTACADALKAGALEVLDTAGRFRGQIPGPATAPHPFRARAKHS